MCASFGFASSLMRWPLVLDFRQCTDSSLRHVTNYPVGIREGQLDHDVTRPRDDEHSFVFQWTTHVRVAGWSGRIYLGEYSAIFYCGSMCLKLQKHPSW